MKRTPLKRKSKSDSAKLKDEIQATIRELVIRRDGGCIFRNRIDVGPCGLYNTVGELVLQAEHLVTRSRAKYFADPRNVVCLCGYHHLFFKPQHSVRYWKAVENEIGEDRWKWLQLALEDHTAHKVDLKLELLALKQELKNYGQNH